MQYGRQLVGKQPIAGLQHIKPYHRKPESLNYISKKKVKLNVSKIPLTSNKDPRAQRKNMATHGAILQEVHQEYTEIIYKI